MDKETREIKGKIEAWAGQINEFANGRGSLGLKVKGEWHNLIGDTKALLAVKEQMPKDAWVEFKETKNNRGYWDINKGSIQITKPDVAEEKEETKKIDNKTLDIDFAVCYKAAVELFNTEERKKLAFPQIAINVADLAVDLFREFEKAKKGAIMERTEDES